jgi:hypothetical protein
MVTNAIGAADELRADPARLSAVAVWGSMRGTMINRCTTVDDIRSIHSLDQDQLRVVDIGKKQLDQSTPFSYAYPPTTTPTEATDTLRNHAAKNHASRCPEGRFQGTQS